MYNWAMSITIAKCATMTRIPKMMKIDTVNKQKHD